MNLDTVLPLSQVVVTLLLAGLGIEISVNPRTTRNAKFIYRGLCTAPAWMDRTVGVN